MLGDNHLTIPNTIIIVKRLSNYCPPALSPQNKHAAQDGNSDCPLKCHIVPHIVSTIRNTNSNDLQQNHKAKSARHTRTNTPRTTMRRAASAQQQSKECRRIIIVGTSRGQIRSWAPAPRMVAPTAARVRMGRTPWALTMDPEAPPTPERRARGRLPGRASERVRGLFPRGGRHATRSAHLARLLRTCAHSTATM